MKTQRTTWIALSLLALLHAPTSVRADDDTKLQDLQARRASLAEDKRQAKEEADREDASNKAQAEKEAKILQEQTVGAFHLMGVGGGLRYDKNSTTGAAGVTALGGLQYHDFRVLRDEESDVNKGTDIWDHTARIYGLGGSTLSPQRGKVMAGTEIELERLGGVSSSNLAHPLGSYFLGGAKLRFLDNSHAVTPNNLDFTMLEAEGGLSHVTPGHIFTVGLAVGGFLLPAGDVPPIAVGNVGLRARYSTPQLMIKADGKVEGAFLCSQIRDGGFCSNGKSQTAFEGTLTGEMKLPYHGFAAVNLRAIKELNHTDYRTTSNGSANSVSSVPATAFQAGGIIGREF